MKISEIKKIVKEIVDEEIEEGVGYVYDKDMKKDPKHIPGERWRIKFESKEDLKKRGDTKKLKTENTTIKPVELKSMIDEIVNEIWDVWKNNKKSKNK